MDMDVTFPGGKKVEVAYKGHTVLTDQPVDSGGEDAAPAPFDLFLVSIGACTGYYVMTFCRTRDIPTEGAGVGLDFDWDEKEKRITRIRVDIRLPEGFPERYRTAVVRAARACTVSRHLDHPPEIEMNTVV